MPCPRPSNSISHYGFCAQRNGAADLAQPVQSDHPHLVHLRSDPGEDQRQGVLIKPNSLTVVQSETNGQIAELSVNVGDCIDEQSLLAHTDPVSQEIEMKAVKTQLDQMLIQDEAQTSWPNNGSASCEAPDIERVTHLAQTGAMSTDELNRRRREFSQLRYAMESENSRREQQIKEQQNRILSRQEEIERTSLIRAPISGALSIGASIRGSGSARFHVVHPATGQDR